MTAIPSFLFGREEPALAVDNIRHDSRYSKRMALEQSREPQATIDALIRRLLSTPDGEDCAITSHEFSVLKDFVGLPNEWPWSVLPTFFGKTVKITDRA